MRLEHHVLCTAEPLHPIELLLLRYVGVFATPVYVLQPVLICMHVQCTTLVFHHQQESETHTSPSCLGENVRKDFPILEETVNGLPLVYLDNAATSQKPLYMLQVCGRVFCCTPGCIITASSNHTKAMDNYYDTTNSNVHRGVHALSAQATADYEAARNKVANFIKANSWREIVFTRNATEGMNLVAYSWGMHNLKPGDEVCGCNMCNVSDQQHVTRIPKSIPTDHHECGRASQHHCTMANGFQSHWCSNQVCSTHKRHTRD